MNAGAVLREAAMYAAFQVMMGILGLFVAWTLIRAVRNGVITSKHVTFPLDERPFAFSAVFAVQAIIGAFCFWTAAGYEPGAFFDFFGLPHGWH